MSKKFLSDVYETEEWTRLDFGSYIDPGSDSLDQPPLSLQYGFWTWDTTDSSHSFVQLRTDSRSMTYFCVNFPTSTVQRIVEGIHQHQKSTGKVFFIDTLITDDLLRSYRHAISSRNKQLISIERETDRSSIGEQTKRLHALSVSWHTIYKDLIDLEEQIKHLRQLHNGYAAYKTGAFQGKSDGIDQLLHQLESKCQFYRRWAMTYRDRTTGRINLVRSPTLPLERRDRLQCSPTVTAPPSSYAARQPAQPTHLQCNDPSGAPDAAGQRVYVHPRRGHDHIPPADIRSCTLDPAHNVLFIKIGLADWALGSLRNPVLRHWSVFFLNSITSLLDLSSRRRSADDMRSRRVVVVVPAQAAARSTGYPQDAASC